MIGFFVGLFMGLILGVLGGFSFKKLSNYKSQDEIEIESLSQEADALEDGFYD